MNDTGVLLPLVEKLFEHDLAAATHFIKGMGEEEAAEVLRSLPPHLAARSRSRSSCGALSCARYPRTRPFNLFSKRGGLGTINGIVIGLVTPVGAWIWYESPYLGLVIGPGHARQPHLRVALRCFQSPAHETDRHRPGPDFECHPYDRH